MAASLDKQMLLKKIQTGTQKNSNSDAAGAVMLLFVVALFMPSSNTKKEK